MSDLKGKQIQAGYDELVTVGTGATPLEDGDGAATFYEEGTWTPTIEGDSSNPTVTYSSQVGFYIVCGDLVTVFLRLIISSQSSAGSGSAEIGGLPYAPTGNNLRSSSILSFYRGLGHDDAISLHIIGGGSTITMYKGATNSNDFDIFVSCADLDAGGYSLYGSITYQK